MTIWEDSAFTQAYDVPGSAPSGQQQTNVIGTSVNSQWGTLLTPFFTGFTAGYWGTTSQSVNTMMPTTTSATNLGGGTIDLNQTLNWSPAYAFDVSRVEPSRPTSTTTTGHSSSSTTRTSTARPSRTTCRSA